MMRSQVITDRWKCAAQERSTGKSRGSPRAVSGCRGGEAQDPLPSVTTADPRDNCQPCTLPLPDCQTSAAALQPSPAGHRVLRGSQRRASINQAIGAATAAHREPCSKTAVLRCPRNRGRRRQQRSRAQAMLPRSWRPSGARRRRQQASAASAAAARAASLPLLAPLHRPVSPTLCCRNRSKGQYGCPHYRRRVRFITPCCDEEWWCRHCHNRAKDTEEQVGAAMGGWGLLGVGMGCGSRACGVCGRSAQAPRG